jgi:hypothetical protein
MDDHHFGYIIKLKEKNPRQAASTNKKKLKMLMETLTALNE